MDCGLWVEIGDPEEDRRTSVIFCRSLKTIESNNINYYHQRNGHHEGMMAEGGSNSSSNYSIPRKKKKERHQHGEEGSSSPPLADDAAAADLTAPILAAAAAGHGHDDLPRISANNNNNTAIHTDDVTGGNATAIIMTATTEKNENDDPFSRMDNSNDDTAKNGNEEDFETGAVIIPSASTTDDGNGPPNPAPPSPSLHFRARHDEKFPLPHYYPSLRRAIVTNDGSSQNLIHLIGLKSLFAKQLPKMPKEYIARLVFDRNHISLALLHSPSSSSSDDTTATASSSKRYTDEEIIGGICYRPYYDMKFAEIAFCAISASQQVKGYGSKLMNLAKMHASSNGNIEYFITYADNYAIGYFKKQGFTKSVQMHKSRYQGLIKDYDGGTIMECYIHPSIDYTRVPEMIRAQKQFILERIRAISKSDKMATMMEEGQRRQNCRGGGGGGYPPLPSDFASRMMMERSSIAGGGGARGGTDRASVERALSIPGVVEAGWTASDILSLLHRNGGKDTMDRRKSQLRGDLLNIVSKVSDQQFAWCFRDPVNTDEVKDYLTVIKDPIDLRTMEKRIRKGDHYKNVSMLYVDMMKMANNCKVYNGETSPYYEYAVSLEKYLGVVFPKRVVTSAASSSIIADDSGGDATIGEGT